MGDDAGFHDPSHHGSCDGSAWRIFIVVVASPGHRDKLRWKSAGELQRVLDVRSSYLRIDRTRKSRPLHRGRPSVRRSSSGQFHRSAGATLRPKHMRRGRASRESLSCSAERQDVLRLSQQSRQNGHATSLPTPATS